MNEKYTIEVHADKDLEWELKSLIRGCDKLLANKSEGRILLVPKKELEAHRNSISFCLGNYAHTVMKERNLFLRVSYRRLQRVAPRPGHQD